MCVYCVKREFDKIQSQIMLAMSTLMMPAPTIAVGAPPPQLTMAPHKPPETKLLTIHPAAAAQQQHQQHPASIQHNGQHTQQQQQQQQHQHHHQHQQQQQLSIHQQQQQTQQQCQQQVSSNNKPGKRTQLLLLYVDFLIVNMQMYTDMSRYVGRFIPIVSFLAI